MTIDPDSLHQRRKPRVGMQRVEHRILREKNHHRRSVLYGAIEPQERILSVAQSRVDQGDVVRGDVAFLR